MGFQWKSKVVLLGSKIWAGPYYFLHPFVSVRLRSPRSFPTFVGQCSCVRDDAGNHERAMEGADGVGVNGAVDSGDGVGNDLVRVVSVPGGGFGGTDGAVDLPSLRHRMRHPTLRRPASPLLPKCVEKMFPEVCWRKAKRHPDVGEQQGADQRGSDPFASLRT